MRLFSTMATMCIVNVHKSTKVTKAKAHIAHRKSWKRRLLLKGRLCHLLLMRTESLVLRSNNRNLILKSRESLVPRSCRWQVMESASVKFAVKNLLWAQWGDTWKTCTIHPIFSSATYAEESFRQMRDLKSTAPKNMWQMKFHFMNALIFGVCHLP